MSTSLHGTPQPLGCFGVERSSRLVEEQDAWNADQRASERQLLNHSCRATIDSLGQDRPELEFLLQGVDHADGVAAAYATNTGEEESLFRPDNLR